MPVFAVEHADAGRSVQLVTGHDVEIAIDVADIDIHVYRRLRAVDQDWNPARMRQTDDLLDWHDAAQHVRHLGYRDQLRLRRQELLELANQEIAVIIDRRPSNHGALTLTQEVPGHDVGVVLHDREHDFVALADPFAPEGLRYEIDRLRGAASEHDLFAPVRIEEFRDLVARALIGLRRGIGEVMQAAMHVGVLAGVGLR